MFKLNEITLILLKCHFIYFNIKTFEHYVFQLKLNIMKEKIETIRKIKFFRNLKKLKIKLRFFKYYKFFVNHYAIITKSLMKFKIKDFRNNFIKNRFRKKHVTKLRFREQFEVKQVEKFKMTLNINEKCLQI